MVACRLRKGWRPRRSDLSNSFCSALLNLDFDDPLDTARADHHRNADIHVLHAILAVDR